MQGEHVVGNQPIRACMDLFVSAYQVMKVVNKEAFPEKLKWIKFSGIAWTHDHKGFFYQVYNITIGLIIYATSY